MDIYDPNNDRILVLDQWVSPSRAKQIESQIDTALEIRDIYQNSPEYHDMGLNERALRLLTGDKQGEDLPVRVGIAFDDEAALASEYIIEWIEQYDSAGDVAIRECDVQSFFEESNGVTGLHVEEYVSVEGE